MTGETKSCRSPNILLLALRECESLIIGPARDISDREDISDVLLAHRAAIGSIGPD